MGFGLTDMSSLQKSMILKSGGSSQSTFNLMIGIKKGNVIKSEQFECLKCQPKSIYHLIY
jgi:hypothetical protein